MAKKLFYKIGEACKILDIQPYVLRYWETEFPFLSPNKSKSGQRSYSEREIEVIRRIKELLYEEGYTIAGAKKKLETELVDGELKPVAEPAAKVTEGGQKKNTKKTSKSPPPAVDSGASEKIEKLRSGLAVALDQARGILEQLAPKAS